MPFLGTSLGGATPLSVLGLMIFIDHSLGLRQIFGCRVSKKHVHWWCVLSQCPDPVQVEGRSCMRSSPSTLTADCFARSWISLVVLPEGALHVHVSHQVWPQRRKHWGTPVNVLNVHVYYWGKNSELSGSFLVPIFHIVNDTHGCMDLNWEGIWRIILQSAKCSLVHLHCWLQRYFHYCKAQGAHYNRTSYTYMMQDDDRYNAWVIP